MLERFFLLSMLLQNGRDSGITCGNQDRYIYIDAGAAEGGARGGAPPAPTEPCPHADSANEDEDGDEEDNDDWGRPRKKAGGRVRGFFDEEAKLCSDGIIKHVEACYSVESCSSRHNQVHKVSANVLCSVASTTATAKQVYLYVRCSVLGLLYMLISLFQQKIIILLTLACSLDPLPKSFIK
ncbi:uncharacterized protein [Miscanthus floridulus]|uniref:uncharacterized protein n=1 Tax=Miscanthus floridulus TaxID=154761 RepID=UPI00345825A9